MHPSLHRVFKQTVDIFMSDERVSAAWITGSAKSKSEDVYSDVDPVFVINDDDFDQFDSELRSVFEKITDEIILWWPERGNNDMVRNYAILFKSPELLQYDINIMKESAFSANWLINTAPEQILFDKKGMLNNTIKQPRVSSYSPDKLLYNIELFWVYGYIIPKYLLRNQTFKIIYAQNIFFECHMEVLHALNPDVYWDWLPINVHKLFDENKKKELHRYFLNADRKSVAKVLISELDAFSKDARLACEKWNIPYPDRLESEIRDFIIESGCIE